MFLSNRVPLKNRTDNLLFEYLLLFIIVKFKLVPS